MLILKSSAASYSFPIFADITTAILQFVPHLSRYIQNFMGGETLLSHSPLSQISFQLQKRTLTY